MMWRTPRKMMWRMYKENNVENTKENDVENCKENYVTQKTTLFVILYLKTTFIKDHKDT